MASSHVQHIQKALDQMNLQLHHVISDITGMTGLAIIEAILAGERNPQTLAKLRDGRIKATESTIAKSLVGDYRREHLFTLGQSLAAYRHYQKLIGACDKEIEQYLETFEPKADPPEDPKWKDRKSTRLNSSHSQISYAVFCLKIKKYYLIRRLLMKIPPAPAGLIILLGYFDIGIYYQFFVACNDIILPDFSEPLPKAPLCSV